MIAFGIEVVIRRITFRIITFSIISGVATGRLIIYGYKSYFVGAKLYGY